MLKLSEPEYESFLVTGGAGFIGSHIVDRLLVLEKRVYVLDDFSTGKMINLSQHSKNKRLRVIRGSITNPHMLADLARRVNCVYHEAAQVSVVKSFKDPIVTNRINSEGTLLLIRACAKTKNKRFVYASSSSVYGDVGDRPAREDMAPGPLSPYAASKQSGESYVMAFSRSCGLHAVSLRYFNVYGQRQNSSMYGGVVSIFFRRARKKLSPIICGDGEQTRDFTFVSDVVEANMLAAKIESSEVINVGTGKSTKIRDLAELVCAECGDGTLAPAYDSARPGEVRHSVADVTRGRSVLGFQAKVSIREGIRSMLEAAN